jgi:hypothetical protein
MRLVVAFVKASSQPQRAKGAEDGTLVRIALQDTLRFQVSLLFAFTDFGEEFDRLSISESV